MNYGRSDINSDLLSFFVVTDNCRDCAELSRILDLSFQKIKFASQGLSQSTYCNHISLVRIISVVYFSAIEMRGAINL